MGLRPRSGLSSRLVDGEMVILDREKERVHQLNSTATLVWGRLTAGASVSDIALELTELFDVAEGTASADVARIVKEFENLNLVASSVNPGA